MSYGDIVPSLITPYGPYSSEKCGYCKGGTDEERNTWGMGTTSLTVSDYQYLIDRGWRRSGTYCYKPLNDKTCCPCYTIRCDVRHFRPSRAHKRILRNIQSFLLTGAKPDNFRQAEDTSRSDAAMANLSTTETEKTSLLNLGAFGDRSLEKNPRLNTSNLPANTAASLTHAISNEAAKSEALHVAPSGDVTQSEHTNNRSSSSVASKPRPKARERRWDRKKKRMQQRAQTEGRTFDQLMQEYTARRELRLAKNRPKELEDLLLSDPPKPDQKHFIEIRLVRSQPQSAEFQRTLSVEHALYQKYQQVVHGDNPKDCDLQQFKRFLVESPLVPDYTNRPANCTGPELGSYHQQYWLDGRELIAVGVIDLLPRCLSSVYFIYDPDYAFLRLGVYSALREIAFVRQLAKQYGPLSSHPDPQYAHFDSYYMGYYIRSCRKMAYKAQYRPSFLACPESYTWIPLDQCLARLDASPGGKYARFSASDVPDANAIPSDLSMNELEQHVLCELSRKLVFATNLPTRVLPLSQFKQLLRPHVVESIHECIRLLGNRAISGHFRLTF